MTKLRNPLHSQAASGKMDEETILVTRRGKTYRKRYAVPRDAKSERQREERRLFVRALKLWEELDQEDREAWVRAAVKFKKKDLFSGGWMIPGAHVIFQTFARRALRAGLPIPHLPPSGPSPQSPVLFLEPKGKGILVRWREMAKLVPGKKPGVAPALLELRAVVTRPTVNPPERDHRLVGFFPAGNGEYLFRKGRPGMKHSFLAFFLNYQAQTSLPFRNFITLS
jgi:hypothetical protein